MKTKKLKKTKKVLDFSELRSMVHIQTTAQTETRSVYSKDSSINGTLDIGTLDIGRCLEIGCFLGATVVSLRAS